MRLTKVLVYLSLISTAPLLSPASNASEIAVEKSSSAIILPFYAPRSEQAGHLSDDEAILSSQCKQPAGLIASAGGFVGIGVFIAEKLVSSFIDIGIGLAKEKYTAAVNDYSAESSAFLEIEENTLSTEHDTCFKFVNKPDSESDAIGMEFVGQVKVTSSGALKFRPLKLAYERVMVSTSSKGDKVVAVLGIKGVAKWLEKSGAKEQTFFDANVAKATITDVRDGEVSTAPYYFFEGSGDNRQPIGWGKIESQVKPEFSNLKNGSFQISMTVAETTDVPILLKAFEQIFEKESLDKLSKQLKEAIMTIAGLSDETQ